jgi:very-short-patch-repair endonuclease
MRSIGSRAQHLRRSQTPAEGKLWQALRNRQMVGCKFRRQHPIDRYVVDFVSIAAKLVIEIDGDTHGSPEAMERDEARTRVIESCGFRVVRVTNAEIVGNLEGVLEFIRTELGIASA